MFYRAILIVGIVCAWSFPAEVWAAQGAVIVVDSDGDGLSDELELQFRTDIYSEDTDGDGYSDGREVNNGYDPLSQKPTKLPKKIDISLKDQRLRYSLGGVVLGSMKISSGVPRLPTPKGTSKILNKDRRAWSKSAKLWMPWWMAFAQGGKIGLHELPEWPDGRKEGEKSLGTPASHGCVRLGVGDAKKLFDWTPIGTPVTVH